MLVKRAYYYYTTRPDLFARRADAPVQDANAGRPVRSGSYVAEAMTVSLNYS